MAPTNTAPFGSFTPIRRTPEAPAVRHPVTILPFDEFIRIGAGEKTQPVEVTFEDVVVDEADDDDDNDVSLLDVVETTLEEVVVDEVEEDVSLLDVVV
jgi:hypothetical protein